MLRTLLDATARSVAWTKRHRRIRPTDHVVKVNIGCGLTVADGWWNVDASLNSLVAAFPETVQRVAYRSSGSQQWFDESEYVNILSSHRFLHHDLAFGLPFADASVDFVYSSHFFEHIFRDDALHLLRDCRRAMKPHAIIRIAVPDLAHAVALYTAGRRHEALEFFFSDSRAGALARHQYMYDFELMRELLADAGFVSIERCAFTRGRVPDIAVLDNRPEQTLFVEAVRPA